MSATKKKGLAKVNTEGWMMSYADMATILLAMFIVLTVLGKDQTGAALHTGLESYRQARDSFGLPGMFEASPRSVQFDQPMTRFSTGEESDSKDNTGRSIDAEQERLQRFLDELGRKFSVDCLPRSLSQATVDLFERFQPSAPYLKASHREIFSQVLPLLQRPNYRVTVTVWATMPADSAWLRAADQAQAIVEDLNEDMKLGASARSRLIAIGQPWPYSNYERPILSITVAKTQ